MKSECELMQCVKCQQHDTLKSKVLCWIWLPAVFGYIDLTDTHTYDI